MICEGLNLFRKHSDYCRGGGVCIYVEKRVKSYLVILKC
jgi:hypothetical protein